MRDQLGTCQNEAQSLEQEVCKTVVRVWLLCWRLQTVTLKTAFQKRTGEAECLKNDVEKAECRLNAARDLVLELSEEKARWEGTLHELTLSASQTTRRALLAAAYVSYLISEEPHDRRVTLKASHSLRRIHASTDGGCFRNGQPGLMPRTSTSAAWRWKRSQCLPRPSYRTMLQGRISSAF